MKITEQKFYEDCKKLANRIISGYYDSIYGIPNGGFRVAIELGKLLKLPVTNKICSKTLIVDDLIDSGATLKKLQDCYYKNDYAVLYCKKYSPNLYNYRPAEIINDWIEFWYEDTQKDKEKLITRVLENIKENPNREGLLNTPKRVVKMWDEIFGGYQEKPENLFKAVFKSNSDEMVIVKDIPFYSHCEHHMVPFFGKIYIGYIPNGKVLGLSKFARLAEIYAKRLQIQENLTTQIADDIIKYLKPKGVMVVVNAEHLCMSMRGVKKPGSSTITSATRGCFRNEQNTRQEFLSLIKE